MAQLFPTGAERHQISLQFLQVLGVDDWHLCSGEGWQQFGIFQRPRSGFPFPKKVPFFCFSCGRSFFWGLKNRSTILYGSETHFMLVQDTIKTLEIPSIPKKSWDHKKPTQYMEIDLNCFICSHASRMKQSFGETFATPTLFFRLWLSTANCAAMRKRQLCEWPGNCVYYIYYTYYTITRIYMASGLASLQQWEVNDWIGFSQEQQIYRRKHRNTVVDENNMNKHKPWFSVDFPQTKSLSETLQKPRAGPHMIPQALLPVAVKVTSLCRMTSNIWSSIAATWRFTFLCGCISRSYENLRGTLTNRVSIIHSGGNTSQNLRGSSTGE